MEGSNGVSNSSNFSSTNNRSQMLHPPISPLLCISPPLSDGKYNVDGQHSHHRCSSESVAIDEQPSWLDDLLNEPEMQQLQPKSHRRSASDTSAFYFDESDTMPQHTAVFNPWMIPQNVVHRGDPKLASFNTNANVNRGLTSRFSTEALLNHSISPFRDGITLQVPGSTSGLLADQEMPAATQTINGQNESGESSDQSQAMSSAWKAEAKRAKQQSAHRSRVRKLQYIAELERHVQLFQTETLKLAGEYEFLDQQNLILGMENRALRQRLESISQEHLVRNLEHDMLERELVRLQMLYQVQRQQLQQQQHYPKHRRSKSRDSGNKSLRNKEAASSNHVSCGDLESHLASLSSSKEASS